MRREKNTTQRKKRIKFFSKKAFLEKLAAAGAVAAEEFFKSVSELANFGGAMLLSYDASYRALRNMALGRGEGHDMEWYERHARAAFAAQMSRLKKAGLVAGSGDGMLSITKAGEAYAQIKSPTPPWSKVYPCNTARRKSLKLFIFDIPESQRLQRDWLRHQLEQFEFVPLQKSVLCGTTVLPEEFIADLQQYRIMPYVHIVNVNRRGTISEFLERIGRH